MTTQAPGNAIITTASNNNNNNFGNSKVEVIVLAKSDKTIKNNIDAKDESVRKRTSLIIVPQQQQLSQQRQQSSIKQQQQQQPPAREANDNQIKRHSNNIIINKSQTMILSKHQQQDQRQQLKATNCRSSTCSNSSSPSAASFSGTDEDDDLRKSIANTITIDTNNDIDNDNVDDNDNDNKSTRHSLGSVDSCVSLRSSRCSTATTSSSGDDVAIGEDYRDLENGNILDELDTDGDDRKHCISNSSSCIDDYSLREKLQNFVNDALLVKSGQNSSLDGDDCEAEEEEEDRKAVDERRRNGLRRAEVNSVDLEGKNEEDFNVEPRSLPHCDALLSPNEVPMGRRYAEVAQFKPNKRSSSDSQSATATTTLLSSSATSASCQQQHQQIIQTQPNQLKSSTTTTTTSTSSAGSAIVASNNNSRRLPFCGLNSIKGSDNNGGLQQQQQSSNCGTTNLSFDLSSVVPVGSSNNNIAQLDTQSEQFHSLDANDSSCCGDGPFDDDMQALLPKCRLSRDELSPSRTSLVSSSDGGILAEGETSSETSRGSDECPPCDLGLVERLMLTHPVWFLPGIQRSGAIHFLQSKEEGNFIVRGSSQHNTMAVSVRLPPDTGPYIEHYLIQSNEGIISLESSRFKFNSIPALIAHYAQCCDELPVQLVLPRALREAKNRQQLSSLALLGQEFWRYPMSCPKQDETEATLLDAKSPNSLTETSGIGTTIFSNSASSNGPQQSFQQHQQQMQQQQQFSQPQTTPKLFSPTNNLTGIFSQAGTPSDTTSSMSSFTTSGGQQIQLMSPESVDSVILTMSPVDHLNQQRNAINGLTPGCEFTGNMLSTFKSNVSSQIMPFKPNKSVTDNGVRPQRPTPPNTLNLDLRKPPAPPVRWSKPLTPNSPLDTPEGSHQLNGSNNFTVTTTVTFSVDNSNSPQFVEVTTPSTNAMNSAINSNAATFQTFSKRLSPEGECKDTLSSQGSSGSRWHSQSSKDSNNSQRHILSPCSAGTPSGVTKHKSRKSKARKESKHYQESDILESPQIYCRSNLADKFSDYEDLWSHDPSDRAGLLTSFKPNLDGVQGKRPDLLAETPSITSLNCNVLSPANSSMSSASPPNASDTAPTPTADLTADTPQLIQLSTEQTQPRSRAALLLPSLMSESLNEDQLKSTSEGDTTPTAQTPISRSKQGSPFYAEPADALRQAGLNASILRRSHRGALLPANHRHSEPPKGGVMRTPMCALMLSGETEKIAGSLDELKKKAQQPQNQQQDTQQQHQHQHPARHGRGRFEQWQIDSSWEFMSKQRDIDDNEDDDDDYDSADHWNPPTQTSQEKQSSLGSEMQKEVKEKPITIHQIIAKRLPDLNLPELVRCSTPQQQQQPHQNGSQKSIDSQTGCRLSSYDNVERNLSFFNGIDSSQSDDGTVFSEPWDPSQWDSFLPQDDVTLTSDSIHLSKCRPAVSEDDTIIEELNTKEHNQDTLKARRTHGRQKVATILRNPSIRDREILCE